MKQRLALLIDADDTLWENNIYFEDAIAAFIRMLDHGRLNGREIRQVINRVEGECIVRHGYGLASFARALENTCTAVQGTPPDEAQLRQIAAIASVITHHPMELLEGVEETLAWLHKRHRLIVVTKGNKAEQTDKFRRSGLERFFEACVVLEEKDAAHYTELLDRHALETSATWMIGNSPKSDINQSMAAGLNAVYIPHSETWVLEHEALRHPAEGRNLLHLQCFAELKNHF
jgi:putative hydrolase of the HAD superfamily